MHRQVHRRQRRRDGARQRLRASRAREQGLAVAVARGACQRGAIRWPTTGPGAGVRGPLHLSPIRSNPTQRRQIRRWPPPAYASLRSPATSGGGPPVAGLVGLQTIPPHLSPAPRSPRCATRRWPLPVRAADVFAEIDRQQKERIVHALQRTGHAVGYLGDGINDAPALLRAADVGISVDRRWTSRARAPT